MTSTIAATSIPTPSPECYPAYCTPEDGYCPRHRPALQAPATFSIHPDLDVTQAHGAPSARVYGECQAATNLARCMGSRVCSTTIDGVTWRMERLEHVGGSALSDLWMAVDMTAAQAFSL